MRRSHLCLFQMRSLSASWALGPGPGPGARGVHMHIFLSPRYGRWSADEWAEWHSWAAQWDAADWAAWRQAQRSQADGGGGRVGGGDAPVPVPQYQYPSTYHPSTSPSRIVLPVSQADAGRRQDADTGRERSRSPVTELTAEFATFCVVRGGRGGRGAGRYTPY